MITHEFRTEQGSEPGRVKHFKVCDGSLYLGVTSGTVTPASCPRCRAKMLRTAIEVLKDFGVTPMLVPTCPGDEVTIEALKLLEALS